MAFNYDHNCFCCGERNARGLQLKFVKEGDYVRTTFVPTEVYEGYPGIMHGGITSTILDEIMSQCLNYLGLLGFTARLEVRFRHHVPLNRPVCFEAQIVKRKSSLVETCARAILADGSIAAEATGRFMLISREKQAGQPGST